MMHVQSWHLTGSAAERYEQYVARYILGPWANDLIDAAEIARGEHVLDLACGTGVVARALANRVGRNGQVIGIDLNPEMIAVARAVASTETLRWHVGSAGHLPIADGVLDAVLCQQGLQFFPDRLRAMREIHRVLKQNGRVALSVWSGIGQYNAAVAAALEKHISKEVAIRFLASRRAPDGEELRRIAKQAGFKSIAVTTRRRDIHLPPIERFALNHLSATPVADEVSKCAAPVQRNIANFIREFLSVYATDGGITYPEEIYVLVTGKIRGQ